MNTGMPTVAEWDRIESAHGDSMALHEIGEAAGVGCDAVELALVRVGLEAQVVGCDVCRPHGTEARYGHGCRCHGCISAHGWSFWQSPAVS